MRTPSRLPERLTLFLGLVVAAAALLAALPLGSAVGLLGEVAVQRAVEEVAERVRRAWRAIERDPDALFGSPVRFHAWNAGERPGAVPPGAGPTAADPLLGALLEIAQQRADESRWDEALAACADASRFAESDEELTLLLLRRVQIAVRAGRTEDARRAFEELLEGAPEGVHEEGVSPALLAGIALGPLLEEKERVALTAELTRSWLEGELVLPGEGGAVRRGADGRLRIDLPVRLELLAERLSELAGTPLPRNKALMLDLEGRRIAALEAELGLPLERGPRGVELGLHVARVGDEADAFCWYRVRRDVCHGAFLIAGDLAAAISNRLGIDVDSGLEFSVDFESTPPGREVVASREELVPGLLGFAVSHPDPKRLARAESDRLRALRGGLFALSILAGSAGLAGFVALRRGRALVERERRFVATVSHELRTPVTAIRLVADNLNSGRALGPERLARYGKNLDRESRRLARLVEDVLDLSRIQRGEAPPVRLEATPTDELLDSLEAAARFELRGSEIAFDVERACELPSARVDGEALARAVANLVRNTVTHAAAGRVALRVACRDAGLEIAIRDDGRGVDERSDDSLFQPFARGSDSVRGAGLGLTIVRGIAQAHGGSAKSTGGLDGRGFGILLELPAQSPEDPS